MEGDIEGCVNSKGIGFIICYNENIWKTYDTENKIQLNI